MAIDDILHGITTLVSSRVQDKLFSGTGFFYDKLSEERFGPNKDWSSIDMTWVVTNRHILIPPVDNQETIPDKFTFHLRRIINDIVEWEPVELDRSELIKRARVSQNSDVDIAIVQINDIIEERIKVGVEEKKKYMVTFAVRKDDLPGISPLGIEVTHDAVIVGYPRGFYDNFNKYPIVKSGIIASGWGLKFDNKPYFLIDAKLFPGSSGSLVISKPTNIALINGQLSYSREKQYAFLGIFSGAPFYQEDPIDLDDITIIRKLGFDIGVVWYGHLIEEIIKNGATLG